MPVEEATDCGSEYQTDTQGWASLNVWSAQQAIIEIKIPDPAENRIRAAGFGRQKSTDHATTTDTN